MSAVEQVENVVLGGGEAGKYIAWELGKQGRSTMVIERALVGGSKEVDAKHLAGGQGFAYL